MSDYKLGSRLGWLVRRVSGHLPRTGRSRDLLPCAHLSVFLQAYSLRRGRPVSDADYAPGRTRYENTGQLQLLRKSYQYGTPTNSPTLGNSRSNQTSTQQVDVVELTQQLKIPLYKQLIGNTAMVDLSSLSANPQVSFGAQECCFVEKDLMHAAGLRCIDSEQQLQSLRHNICRG